MLKAFSLGLLFAAPAAVRAQEHRELDLQNAPSPMEAIRDIQNTGRMLFMMADVNHDGQVSQQEAVDANNLLVGGFFFRADADGNGVVSAEEARSMSDRYLNQNPWLKYVVGTLRAQARQKDGQNNTNQGNGNGFQAIASLIDTNSDKQIQATELRQLVQTATQGMFAAADTNRDGQMSPSEVNAAVAGAVRAMGQAAFQQADDDHNGQLSRAEYDKAIIEPASAVFQIIDLNHDGQISQQEAQQIQGAVASQVRMFRLPEPANSPTNLIESGRLPREAGQVPTFSTPNTGGANQNRNPGALAPATPAAPAQPR